MQFSSSIIKSNFGSGGLNSSQKQWDKSNFLYPYSNLVWIKFVASVGQIRNWPTGFDFWHGPKNTVLGYVFFTIQANGIWQDHF
jgi:hypothetical protein